MIRFGTTWHVVVGEGFGFDISYEVHYTAVGAIINMLEETFNLIKQSLEFEFLSDWKAVLHVSRGKPWSLRLEVLLGAFKELIIVADHSR